jgi:hypothetical protein
MSTPPTTGRARRSRRPAPAVLATVLLTGCMGAPPSASPSSVPSVAPTTTPSTAGSVPEKPRLPAGFPVMPGMVADGPSPDEPGLIGRWTTRANGAEVYAFLADALPAAGYRVDLLGPGDTVAVIRFTPPGGQQLQIDLGQAGDRTFMELRLPRG